MRLSRRRSEQCQAALDPSRSIAVWPIGAAQIDGDPWAREDFLRGHLVWWQHRSSGLRCTLGVQHPPTGGLERRDQSPRSGPLSIFS
jgi:hypothetical protein